MRGGFGIVAIATLSSACAGPVATHVSSQGQFPPPGATFAVLTPPATEGSDAASLNAAAMVTRQLVQRGYATAASPTWLVQVALSERAANTSITTGKDGVVALPKKQRLFQNCQDREIRLSIVLLNRATGAVGPSVDAAEFHCNGTVSETLPLLVTAALAQRGAPHRLRRGKD